MPGIIASVANAVFDVVYGIVNDVVNLATGRGAPVPPWTWTAVVDPATPAGDAGVDDLIKAYMRQHGVKAGQCALFVDGVLRMSSAYTWAESGYPITRTDSVMRVASCSKAFTTAAILALLDPPAGQPLLREDDKVFDLLLPPSTRPFPLPVDERVKEITVKHLLDHTGGWNYRTGPNQIRDWAFHLKQIGRDLGLGTATGNEHFTRYVLCDLRLDFDPGTRPVELFTLPGQPVDRMDTYSNIGYILLGRIVEARASSYMGFLDSRILRPLGIGDVSVGATRRDQRRDNEVLYESPYFGPDATRGPYDPKPARFPYGGDGSRKEVMDSSGGLVMSANSLARFVGSHNVMLPSLGPSATYARQKLRTNGTRTGSMPGTQAAAHCFQEKDGSKRYDLAVIFNKQDLSKTDPGDGNSDFERLLDRLEGRIRSAF